MGQLFDRVSRIVRAELDSDSIAREKNEGTVLVTEGAVAGASIGKVELDLVGLNRLLQQGIDPEKLLDSEIEQMEADSQNARQAIVNAIVNQKRLQQQYEKAQTEVNKWKRRAHLASQKGDEYLAREALIRKKMHTGILSNLEAQLNQEPASVQTLKQNLTFLEAKIAEAKSMKTRLKAQIAAAKVNGQLQKPAGNLGASSAMTAFERMEEKMLQIEARSQAEEELTGTDLESQFAMLEPDNDFDEELAVMKAQLLGSVQQLPQSPNSEPSNTLVSCAAVDVELEELKRMLEQL
ncbi:PspA/IM30 family protein [Leptolyngbyaceae cyanobacterium CCMR0082]|uniref:PspA/IM30 family protein n=1 Tax=Adonisia turfae CCMR0082 TaxID=2304604 RepID=A0A6M0SDT0_9CYAN|nr:PspA/IM30 family protein [Adonisia turfae]NEZ66645.1 PspA/IM30 family protein [Adonisia turfae CCMR0082]